MSHRVAVVVFCEVDTESELDAESIAPVAVRKALQKGGDGEFPADISTTVYRASVQTTAVRCLEAGIATANGYLWTGVTSKAFREGGAS